MGVDGADRLFRFTQFISLYLDKNSMGLGSSLGGEPFFTRCEMRAPGPQVRQIHLADSNARVLADVAATVMTLGSQGDIELVLDPQMHLQQATRMAEWFRV